MCKAGDARWTALLGQWLVKVGVLRYKRLNLSTVLKITPSTVRCFCAKGKQAKLRRLQGGGRVHHLAGFWHCSLRFLVGRSHGAGSPVSLWKPQAHWLHINSRALREWAMAPTAVSLGLRPTHPEEGARTPQRTRVVDVIREDKTLPPGVVYVGRGHHSHRLPVTKWSSPFVPGHNCRPLGFHSMWSTSCSTWQGTFRT